jgi:hypothetical protein
VPRKEELAQLQRWKEAGCAYNGACTYGSDIVMEVKQDECHAVSFELMQQQRAAKRARAASADSGAVSGAA